MSSQSGGTRVERRSMWARWAERTLQAAAQWNGRQGPLREIRRTLRQRPRRGQAEALEVRALLAAFAVTSTDDSGAGTLRQAILDANTTPESDSIDFNLAGSGPFVLAPLSALPDVTGSLVVDATTQPGFAGTPLIELDGSQAGAGANGLSLTSSDSQIRGLVINRFSGAGILIGGGSGHVIAGNYIGLDLTGATALANGTGIVITAGATGNRIGGVSAADRNVISGNTTGIDLAWGSSADSNRIQGNYIGTDAAGASAVPNTTGISVGTSSNFVGTDGDGVNDPEEGNVISGNSTGLTVGFSGNRVAGNRIGTNAAGTEAIPGTIGVVISGSNNYLGTDGSVDAFNANERNIISGHTNRAVLAHDGVVIAGNYIGLDVTGTTAIANFTGIQVTGTGVRVGTNADGTADAEERNIISGNTGDGGIEVRDSGTTGAVIAGNYIGTNAAGTLAVPNSSGIRIAYGADNTTIGGTTFAERNLISGNSTGIWMFAAGTTGNSVLGNDIGTTVGGDSPLGNGTGILISDSAGSNTIGGLSAESRNVISGNSGHGIYLTGAGTGNVISGNTVGLNSGHTAKLGNALWGIGIDNTPDVVVGGSSAAAANTVSGNAQGGIYVRGAASTDVVVRGNYVGTTSTGAAGLGNALSGLYAGYWGTANNGPARTVFRDNVSSANGNFGIQVEGTGTVDTVITGNVIGLTPAGTAVLGNSSYGVYVLAGALNTRIGTDGDGSNDASERNLISGNTSHGIRIVDVGTDNTVVAGNYIGTDITGTLDFGNSASGVLVRLGPKNTRIGTDGLGDGAGNAAEANLISGNNEDGIQIRDTGTADTIVAGNHIGVNLAGTVAIANSRYGVNVLNGATGTRIGTDANGSFDAVERNVVSGNSNHGIFVQGLPVTSLTVVDGLIAGTIPRTTASTTIPQADMNDATGPVAGDWAFNHQMPGGRGDNYAFRATGTLQVSTAGDYTFALGGNDGGRLRIDGLDVVVDNTTHSFARFFGTASLTAGTHTFEWVGFESIDVAGFELSVAVGAGLTAPISEVNGWRVLGAANPHAEIQLDGVIDVTAYYQTNGTVIAGNYVGVNAAGTAAIANAGSGVMLDNVPGVQVGGSTTAARNVISGNSAGVNTGEGVFVNRGSGSRIQGNYIGLNAAGNARIANANHGVRIEGRATGTVVGTDGDGINDATEGNVISGNTWDGVTFWTSGGTNTVIAGNLLGTNASGTGAVGNGRFGVYVNSGAAGNRIGSNSDGTSDTLERNIISGNGSDGIRIINSGTSNNVVAGNYIGLNISGTAVIANAANGVLITSSASNNTIGGSTAAARNIISGNNGNGIQISGSGTNNNIVSGNYIGTNPAGTAAVPNAVRGVWVLNGPTGTSIGGNTPTPGTGPGNVISGNTFQVGVVLEGAGTSASTVRGNIIGLDATGQTALGNSSGVWINSGSNTIGGSTAGDRNIISGNLNDGIVLTGTGASLNLVAGNYIGLNAAGTNRVGNAASGVIINAGASSNTIGGTTSGTRNVISGNNLSAVFGRAGVAVSGATSAGNVIQGNYIGTDWTGTVDLGNGEGVFVQGANTMVGGLTSTPGTGAGNVISGNGGGPSWLGNVHVQNSGAAGTQILGNIIGLNASGTAAMDTVNSQYGVYLDSAQNVTVGGSSTQARNIISGQRYLGIVLNSSSGGSVSNNTIQGNYIGTNISGTTAIGSDTGVQVAGTATNNTIGGSTAAARNIISGSGGNGVVLSGSGVSGNKVFGNYIGTDVSGSLDLGNGVHGVLVNAGADDNWIGTNGDGSGDAGEGNVISGNNGWAGVIVSDTGTDRNVVAGNIIGLNAAGTAALGNNGVPIAVVSGADDTRIGTNGNGVSDASERNIISGNLWELLVEGVGTDRTIIAGNYIGTNLDGTAAIGNTSAGITLRWGPQGTRIGTDGSNDAFNASERNVISGNSWVGIQVTTPYWNGQMPAGGVMTSDTVIAGNYIGLNAAGTGVIPNGSAGIFAPNMPRNLRIGTDGNGIADDAERNVISGNNWTGIQVEGWSYMNVLTAEQIIAGTIPRTTASATVAQADFMDTFSVGDWTADNPIPGGGGDIYVMRATGTLQVSTAGTYTFALGSDDGGRLRIDGVDVVVDNANHGFTSFFGNATLTAGTHTFEWIGYEGGGASGFEVCVAVGAGRTGPISEANGWRVVGAANPHPEISLLGAIDATAYYPDPGNLNLTIAGNYIGTDPTGTRDFGNASDGILLQYLAKGVTIGGATAAQRNLISGNNGDGIELNGVNTTNNLIVGNDIGINASGTSTAAGVVGWWRGENNTENVYNGASGTLTNGATYATGLAGTAFQFDGVNDYLNIPNVATHNVTSAITLEAWVNPTSYAVTSGAGPLVIGKGTGYQLLLLTDGRLRMTLPGVGTLTSAAVVPLSSWTHVAGTWDAATGELKLYINGTEAASGSAGGTITAVTTALQIGSVGGTSQQFTGRLDEPSVFGRALSLSEIQTIVAAGATGKGLGNSGRGIYVANAPGNTIQGNLVSGNRDLGILLESSQATGNTVIGNLIGTDAAGTSAIANRGGVYVTSGGHHNRIGTDGNGVNDAQERNVVSGNTIDGIQFYGTGTTGNVAAGNYVGTDVTGSQRLANGFSGIAIFGGAAGNRVGTEGTAVSTAAERNVVGGNVYGVFLGDTSGNLVAGNYLGTSVSGIATAGNSYGVWFAANATGNTVGGTAAWARNVISGNSYGVVFNAVGASGNTVLGNYIGTDVSGTLDLGNLANGVYLGAGSSNNMIGGTAAGARNVISGNNQQGIIITGAGTNGNQVVGNYIGTDKTGDVALGNGTVGSLANSMGIHVTNGALGNIIGTNGDGVDDALEGNVISGNISDGIKVQNLNGLNVIAGNFIGTNQDGTRILGNGRMGVFIQSASQTRVGTNSDGVSDDLERNIISGNATNGVGIVTATSTLNVVAGNYIGTDVTGTLDFGNLGDGVQLNAPAFNNTIGGSTAAARNIISGNQGDGIEINGAGTTGNVVSGNYIGLNAAGTGAIANSLNGILIANGATSNRIGTNGDGLNDAGERNVISGNASGINANINIIDAATQGNVVAGNYIGTTADGSAGVTNNGRGVRVASFASSNRIGTDGSNDAFNASERNVISGHSSYGVFIVGGGTDNVLAGNYIGLNAAGTAAIPNAIDGVNLDQVTRTRVGTNADGIADQEEMNVIAGSGGFGLLVSNNATQNTVAGNRIGTNAAGTVAVPNTLGGILMGANATFNTIGGTAAGAGNLISGNAGPGVYVVRTYESVVYPASPNNSLQGNFIGTDVTGTLALGNAVGGVIVEEPDTRIGGTVPGARNLISGNAGDGLWIRGADATNVVVEGNLIGTDVTGTRSVANVTGVRLEASGNQIGGTTAGARNVISGNSGTGLRMSAAASSSVQGNYIGINAAGSAALGNEIGIELRDGAGGNVIGGSVAGAGNVISGNRTQGIHAGHAAAPDNFIRGNLIGTDATGAVAVGNQVGILLSDVSGTVIGGSGVGDGNVIAGNQNSGLTITGTLATGNRVLGNFFGTALNGNTAIATPGHGIVLEDDVTGNVIGGTAVGEANVIANSRLAGLRLVGSSGNANTIRGNRYFGNLSLGIDAGSDGRTLNDDADADGVLNFPILTGATFDGDILILEGLVGSGKTIDLYVSAPTDDGIGQGVQRILSLTEGSPEDVNPGSGTYGPVMAGQTVSAGSVTASRFRFEIPIPEGVTHGTPLTAVALGSTSEFSPILLAGEVGSLMVPQITLSSTSLSLITGTSFDVDGSFYDPDSTAWTATVDYGDGFGPRPLTLNADNSFRLQHLYAEPGNYSVSVKIRDNSLRSSVALVGLVVQNEAPTASFDEFTISSPASEGQLVTLTGRFEDTGGIHEARVEWGDGTTSVVPVTPGSREFVATHVYVDDSNVEGTATAADVYRVIVTIIDEAGATDTTPVGLFLEEIHNVRPDALQVNFSSTSIREGESVSLTGHFIDPGLRDVHTVRVNWGDGQQSLVTLPAGNRSSLIVDLPELTHVYADDPASGPDQYIVTVEVVDDDEPLQPVAVTQTIVVSNAIPADVLVTTPEADLRISEDGEVLLSGTFDDPGVFDSHVITVNWGDETSPETVTLAAGVTEFAELRHRFADDAPGDAGYTVTIRVADEDNPEQFGETTVTVMVDNVAPILGPLVLSSGGAAVNEGDWVTLTGSYTEVSAADDHIVRVDWGDGVVSEATVDVVTRTFTATHQYLDNTSETVITTSTEPGTGSVTSFEPWQISVTVDDQDGGLNTGVLQQVVNNVAPTVTINPAAGNTNPQLISLEASVSDPGVNDTYQLLWTAEAVGFSGTLQTGSGPLFVVDRSAAPDALWRVTLSVPDDDGDTGTYEMTLLVGTSGDDAGENRLRVTDAMFTGADTVNLMALALEGNDVIDATGVTDPSFSVTLVGGIGVDQLYGGAGDDVYVLAQGDDNANIPLEWEELLEDGVTTVIRSITPVEAGNDRYLLRPNSTLTVIDRDGGNVLDFSLADFGDFSGIRFDLDIASATVLPEFGQDVSATQPDAHFVRTMGRFTQLIGSRFGDTLIGASGSTVDGGAGADRFVVKSGTTGATFFGGADDDTLTIDALAIGIIGLEFHGDDGIDVLSNFSAMTGLDFIGGADDDILWNHGTILDTLEFGGDDGLDELFNLGEISNLEFSGGADKDVLENRGTIRFRLEFSGDDGIDQLVNLGEITELVFTGGADEDVLRNLEGAIIDGLEFAGGADDDELWNFGTILDTLEFGGDEGLDELFNFGEIAELVFTGGADDDVLQNLAGGLIDVLEFGGDDGVDQLINFGEITELMFVGGADDDVLRNLEDGIIDLLEFGGDDSVEVLINLGNDRLFNQGEITELVFTGGADDDVLQNLEGGFIAMVEFEGDEGADELLNFGDIRELVFVGGADDDVLRNLEDGIIDVLEFGGDDSVDELVNLGNDELFNLGSISELVFTGGADDDVLQNLEGGFIAMVEFDGDEGADELFNLGEITVLVFSGGADDDVLQNLDAGLIDVLSFGGDEGADELFNFGEITELMFTGGADDDVLLNLEGGLIDQLQFGGDEGADELFNLGDITELVFTGGADDDVLQNLHGGQVDTLDFIGDGGEDLLVNRGTVLDLTFTGGADDDILLNLGEVDTLMFGGDDGADVLQNDGDFITSLTFTGGADDDVLINNGSEIESLVFIGGADDDVLVSNGDAVGILEFFGDSEDPQLGTSNDTLIVRGSGDGTATSRILFTGGYGKDAFENNAKGFARITFYGGADDDALLNNASELDVLVFNGDDGNDVFVNHGGGIDDLTFTGGADDDVLVNDGVAIVDLTFHGGADDDLLINSGDLLETLTFIGGADDDTLVNLGSQIEDLVFNGGADDDVLINDGPVIASLEFTGDIGNDRLWNRKGGILIDLLTFHGDDGLDVLINDAAGVTEVFMEGGADDDALQNNGTVMVLTFEGGADDDVLINSGVIEDLLTFEGGADDDTLVNRGISVGTLYYPGGAGDDTLFNTGAVDTLIFEGGADDDILQNNGAVAELTFFGEADGPATSDDGADTLVNNAFVATLVFEGGADDDILQNNASVLSVVFDGGADDDVFVNNGSGIDRLEFTGDGGADTLINNGSVIANLIFDGGADADSLRVQGRGIGQVTFTGDAGTDSFTYNAAGSATSTVTFNAGGGNDFFAIRGVASSVSFDGGGGDDMVLIVGSGAMTMTGGEGDDTYRFVSSPLADVTLTDAYSGDGDTSRDTLDFSSFTGGPVTLDLRLVNVWQPQGTGQLRIMLLDGMSMENIIGTPFADTIYGNPRSNYLGGADFDDPFVGPVASSRSVTQWVLLDFDTYTNTGDIDPGSGRQDAGEHVYTDSEREQIRQRVEAVYRGPNAGAPWFDVRVVTDTTELPSGVRETDEFATIYFNRTPDSGRPGGLASEIDPGNVNLDGHAVVQVNGLLGGVITEIDAQEHEEGAGDADASKGNHAAISDTEIGASKPAATSANFVRLSSKVAAHELAHLLGLRHQDSFGPIGSGVHDPPGAGGYKPIYTGPAGGFETFDHLIGSPASVGSTRFDDLNELFFGEREAIKLAWAFSDPSQTTVTESSTVEHGTPGDALPLNMVSLAVPNTLSRGLNQSKDFFVQISSVLGQIDVDSATGRSQNDWYAFTGRAGELVNIDVLSNSVARFGGDDGVLDPDDYVDTIVRVYDANGQLVQYYDGLAENDDTFEPTDSSLIDLLLPADGTYYIEVDTFRRTATDTGYEAAVALQQQLLQRVNDSDPDNDLNPAEQAALARITDTLTDTDTGRYQLIMYKFRKQSASDMTDDLKGFGGIDTINGGPGESYDLEYVLGEDVTGLAEGSAAFSRTVMITDRGASDWTGSMVDYGDGSGPQPLSVSSTGEFTLQHVWSDNGTYQVTVSIVDDIGQSLTQGMTVTVSNVAPTAAISAVSELRQEGTPVLFEGTATDPAGPDDALTLVWDFGDGNTATGALVSHIWADNGVYLVTLTVDDGDGGMAVVSQSITVENVAPTAAITEISPVRQEGTEIVFTGTATDAAGIRDTLTFVWDFGDGTSSVGDGVTHTYADNGVYFVTLTVSDEDGGHVVASQAISVENVAPVAAIAAISTLRQEGTGITFAGTATDPAGIRDTLLYVWDFGDGFTGSGPIVTHAYVEDGDYEVTLTVTDGDGGSHEVRQFITVDNAAPVISVAQPVVTSSLSNRAANQGAYSDTVADTVTLSASIGTITQFPDGTWQWEYDATAELSESLIVTITGVDEDGGVGTATFTAIFNLPPEAAVSGRATGVRGQSLDFEFSAVDPNPVDQSALFTWTIKWGDGSTQIVTGPATMVISHTYAADAAAPYVIRAVVTDARGLDSEETTHEVRILRWEIQSDPLQSGSWILVVGGSQQDDDITVTRHSSDRNGYYELEIDEDDECDEDRGREDDREDDRDNDRDNDRGRDRDDDRDDDRGRHKHTIRIDTSIAGVIVYGQGGDDRIELENKIKIWSVLDGGSGDDRITGGGAANIILGGDGDDRLDGEKGRDLLIGGRGADRIDGGKDDDLIIAGHTALDSNREALQAILREWTSNRSFSQRRSAIMGTTAGGLNGSWSLKNDGVGRSVFDDGALDQLWGGEGRDWFLLNLESGQASVRDRIMDWRHQHDEDDDVNLF